MTRTSFVVVVPENCHKFQVLPLFYCRYYLAPKIEEDDEAAE